MGVEAVLEAMIVQRRSSSHNLRQSAPSFTSDARAGESVTALDTGELELVDPEALGDDDDEADEITTPDTFAARSRERARTSEVFLKVR